MTEVAISVQNVSKCYRVFDDQRSRLLHAVWPQYTKGMHEIWALREVSVEIKRGESFGVIGRNGSGKSTLLEIITQTLTPTTGEVEVNGRVAALLELGSGFNPDYTGRQNVFLNGLLLGLTRGQVQDRFDDIAAFADIGNVLDQQVKTYSSGMLVRLAFAVQVALDPEILVVDEALSVGDYFFQQKCFARLRQMREGGLTLLFVSHDMGTVRDLCSRAIYLRQGVPVFTGNSQSAIQQYFSEGTTSTLVKPGVAAANGMPTYLYSPNLDADISDAAWSRSLTDGGRLFAVHIVDLNEQPVDHARLGTVIRIKVHYRSLAEDVGTSVMLSVKNRYDQVIFATDAKRLGVPNCDIHQASFAVFSFETILLLEGGFYSFRVGIGQPIASNKGLELDTTDWFGPFCVDWDYEAEAAPFLGMFGLPTRGSMVLLK